MESRATAAAAQPRGRREALMDNIASRTRSFVVRSATAADVPAIAAIYDYHVAHHAASIQLHARHGFAEAGRLIGVGHKFDRWLDTVLMQRALGAGAALPPSRL